jgi:anti-sigma regulatory factor (Ser/Thr protein kinase)
VGDDLTDIESAVGEALANCAEHGSVNGSTIDVRCRYSDGMLSIEIQDGGGGFEHWTARDCPRPQSDAPRGYGTYIMRRLMDEIEYSERGTRVRMVKRAPVGTHRQSLDERRRERFG